MPTYTVNTANVSLTAEQKAALAEIITAAHSQHTGAPGSFAQVFFVETRCGDHFIGGNPNAAPHVFVLGQIRAGRGGEVKAAIIEQIITQAASALAVAREDVWVYIQDIDADQMAEFGRILPAPGEESAWQAGMSEEKRAQLRNAGVKI